LAGWRVGGGYRSEIAAVGIEEAYQVCVRYAGGEVDVDGVGEGSERGRDCIHGAVGVDWSPTVMPRIGLRGHFAFLGGEGSSGG
jgi:hypothetical protein